jgi:recombination DNA repair RAD52 pathway protein
MGKTLQEIEKELNELIPTNLVKQREGGGGKQLSYLEGHTVIGALNRIFGPLNWASETKEMECLYQGEVTNSYGKKINYVSYRAKVRLVVVGPDGKATEHTLNGFGDGQDRDNIGKAHELAIKEAETDALKRAAKNLGNIMGLELYSKERNAERDAEREEEPAKQKDSKVAQKASGKKPANEPASSDERSKVLKLITATSKVVVERSKATLDDLKAELKKRYDVDSKDSLTLDQAKEFLGYLNEKNV